MCFFPTSLKRRSYSRGETSVIIKHTDAMKLGGGERESLCHSEVLVWLCEVVWQGLMRELSCLECWGIIFFNCLGRLDRKAFGIQPIPFSMQNCSRSMNILTKNYFIKRVDCLMNCPCEPSNAMLLSPPPLNKGKDSYHEELAYQITVIACVEYALFENSL